jgi:hypothetical protein
MRSEWMHIFGDRPMGLTGKATTGTARFRWLRTSAALLALAAVAIVAAPLHGASLDEQGLNPSSERDGHEIGNITEKFKWGGSIKMSPCGSATAIWDRPELLPALQWDLRLIRRGQRPS